MRQQQRASDKGDAAVVEEDSAAHRMSYNTSDPAPAAVPVPMLGAEETPEKEQVQKQKRLALLASGWSLELVRKRAVQNAFDSFIIVS